jgi:hypothetical protein
MMVLSYPPCGCLVTVVLRVDQASGNWSLAGPKVAQAMAILVILRLILPILHTELLLLYQTRAPLPVPCLVLAPVKRPNRHPMKRDGGH